MKRFLQHVLSHACGPFWQFVKYGVIGVLSTLVQIVIFYALATTCLACLTADDVFVRLFDFPCATISNQTRAWHFACATAIGFVASNIFCWFMNRQFVFRAGKFHWALELLYFMSVSGFAMLLATVLSGFLITQFGLMTTLAVLVEIFVSFFLNFFIRKFFIFKG